MFPNNQKFRNKKFKRDHVPAVDLFGKVKMSGGPNGGALENSDSIAQEGTTLASGSQLRGLYGNRISTNRSIVQPRAFRANPRNAATKSSSESVASLKSRFSRSRSGSALKVNNNIMAVHVLCAISENLARETCVCSLDAGSPTALEVAKQGNGQTYIETISYLEILRPNEILLNEGRRHSQLAKKIIEVFDVKPAAMVEETNNINSNATSNRYGALENTCVIKFISRAFFDQTKGAELLRRIAREETYDQTVVEEYILLSSAHALIQYSQQCLGAVFARNSVYLNVNSGTHRRMTIDRTTLLQLEVLVNCKTGKTKHSLIETIDCTKTVVGSRLLRRNLISPSLRVDTINARLDLVDLFLSNEEFFYATLDHLNSIPEVDKMLSNIALVSQKKQHDGNSYVDERLASKGISALVCIKTTLQALPSLAEVLGSIIKSEEQGIATDAEEGNDNTTHITDKTSLLVGLGSGDPINTCQNHLLKAIYFSLSQPVLQEVLNAVVEVFTDTTSYSRNPNAMRHQECFALKCEENGMMSVLRKAFLANVDDIYKKADEYAEVHGFQVTVRYSSGRGYYLSVPADVATNLPQIFLQPARSGRFVNCTTEEITSLNSRAQDNVHDILLMTHDRIQKVLEVARSNYDAIASMCDAIALLDMCHSFADNVTLNKLPWCRPVITDKSKDTRSGGAVATTTASVLEETSRALMIRNGRYPIDISNTGLIPSDGPSTHIPNDTYAADGKNFTVVTGINGSGKTTYLKQIALITILAHCGSYVPAEAASIPICDRICCRIGSADDNEHNLSTFMLEMKETAFICNNATDRSLVLLDELGRATSNEDGVAIAWAVCEYLMKKRAMTFFVTHYPQLSQLAEIYPMVQNIFLDANITNNGNESEITYTHRVKPGPLKANTDYGVSMAAACGWPIEAITIAKDLEKEVKRLLPYESFCDPDLLNKSNSRQVACDLLEEIRFELLSLVDAERVQSYDSLRSVLSALQTRVNNSGEEVQIAIDQILDRKHKKMPQRFDQRDGSNIHHDPNENPIYPEANPVDGNEFQGSIMDKSSGSGSTISSSSSSDLDSGSEEESSENDRKRSFKAPPA